MLMLGVVLICATLFRDILKFFDERHARKLINHPDKEYVAEVMRNRHRKSLFQVIATFVFTIPFVFLQITKEVFMKFSAEHGQFEYVWKLSLFTSVIFTMAAFVTTLFFRRN